MVLSKHNQDDQDDEEDDADVSKLLESIDQEWSQQLDQEDQQLLAQSNDIVEPWHFFGGTDDQYTYGDGPDGGKNRDSRNNAPTRFSNDWCPSEGYPNLMGQGYPRDGAYPNLMGTQGMDGTGGSYKQDPNLTSNQVYSLDMMRSEMMRYPYDDASQYQYEDQPWLYGETYSDGSGSSEDGSQWSWNEWYSPQAMMMYQAQQEYWAFVKGKGKGFMGRAQRFRMPPQAPPGRRIDPSSGMTMFDDRSGSLSHPRVPRDTPLEEKFGAQNKDEVTTLMIRNIPNRYTRKMLMDELDLLGFKACYDFIYLPMDKVTHWNVGYAFVNFLRPEVAQQCMEVMTEYRFRKFNGVAKKIAQVSVAHIQGLEKNLEHYSQTAIQHTPNESHRPLVLGSRQGLMEQQIKGVEYSPWPTMQNPEEDELGPLPVYRGPSRRRV